MGVFGDGVLNLNNIEQSLKTIGTNLAAILNGLQNNTLSIILDPVTSGTITTAQVTVTNGGDLLAAANTARKSITFNNTGAQTVFIGATGVSATTGYPVPTMTTYTMSGVVSTAAIYGITASSTSVVAVLEV